MASAIKEHLRKQPTQPKNTPLGYAPPNPAGVGRFDPAITGVVLAYFGVQGKGWMRDEPFTLWCPILSIPMARTI